MLISGNKGGVARMSKRTLKWASMLLAMMMGWAMVPGFGMAENVAANVTTPSDLPGATEVPTEEPTEEPTQEPTEEPTEVPTEVPTEEPTEEPSEEPTEEPTQVPTEEPPVFVVEEEEPPMLMASAEGPTIEYYGIHPGNGASSSFTFDENGFPTCITLESGTFTGAIKGGIDVVVQSKATLYINGDSNFGTLTVYGGLSLTGYNIFMIGFVTVNGGWLTDNIGCEFRKNPTTVTNGGKATFRGRVHTLNVSGGSSVTITDTGRANDVNSSASTIHVNDNGKISTQATVTGGTIYCNKGSIDTLTMINASGQFENLSSISNLKISSLSTGKSITANGATIGSLKLPDYVWQKIASDYASEALALVGGDMPTTVTYEAPMIEYEDLLSLHHYCSLYYAPASNVQIPYDAKTFAYSVICWLAMGSQTVNIDVPVQQGVRKIVLSGGTIEKVYDGNGRFVDVTVKDPQWTLDGNAYTDQTIACTVSGNTNNKDAGTHDNVECIVKVHAADLPANTIVMPSGTVSLKITKRPVTLSGFFYRTIDDYTTKFIDLLQHGEVKAEGLAEGDPISAIDPKKEIKAFDEQRRDITKWGDAAYVRGERYKVASLTKYETANYKISLSGLEMYIRKRGNARLAAYDWMIGDGDFPIPEVFSDDYDVEGLTILYSVQYAAQNQWKEEPGVTAGWWTAHVIIPAQGELEGLTLSADYTVDTGFTITIPATASVNHGSMNITCSGVTYFELHVYVASENHWKLISEDGHEIPYHITSLYSNMDRSIAAIMSKRKNNAKIEFILDGTSSLGGNYTDLLTFTVKYQHSK